MDLSLSLPLSLPPPRLSLCKIRSRRCFPAQPACLRARPRSRMQRGGRALCRCGAGCGGCAPRWSSRPTSASALAAAAEHGRDASQIDAEAADARARRHLEEPEECKGDYHGDEDLASKSRAISWRRRRKACDVIGVRDLPSAFDDPLGRRRWQTRKNG